MITQAYNLNLIPEYGTVPIVVKASQYDDGDRIFQFDMLNGDMVYEIPSGSSVRIQGTKPDSYGFSYSTEDTRDDGRKVVSFSGSTVTVICGIQMTATVGEVRAELRIVTPTGDTGSANFVLKVEPAGLNNDTDISETDIPAIVALAEKQMEAAQASAEAAGASETAAATSASVASEAAESAKTETGKAKAEREAAEIARAGAEMAEENAQSSEEDAKDYANLSKSYTVGTDGEVREGDATDNAEYYSRQSRNSATAAKASEDEAKNALDNVDERIKNALGDNIPKVWIDFETGELVWEGGSFVFAVNHESGDLEWELAA